MTAHSRHCSLTCRRAWPRPGGGGSRMLQISCSRVSSFIIPRCKCLQHQVGVLAPKTQRPMGWSPVGSRWEHHGGAAVQVQGAAGRSLWSELLHPLPAGWGCPSAPLQSLSVSTHRGGDGSEPAGPWPSHPLLGDAPQTHHRLGPGLGFPGPDGNAPNPAQGCRAVLPQAWGHFLEGAPPEKG